MGGCAIVRAELSCRGSETDSAPTARLDPLSNPLERLYCSWGCVKSLGVEGGLHLRQSARAALGSGRCQGRGLDDRGSAAGFSAVARIGMGLRGSGGLALRGWREQEGAQPPPLKRGIRAGGWPPLPPARVSIPVGRGRPRSRARALSVALRVLVCACRVIYEPAACSGRGSRLRVWHSPVLGGRLSGKCAVSIFAFRLFTASHANILAFSRAWQTVWEE